MSATQAMSGTPNWSLEPTLEGQGLMFNDKSLNWMVSYQAIVGSILFYLSMNFFLTKFMKNRKAVDGSLLTWTMRVYNVVQIVTCSYMVWGFAKFMHFQSPKLPPMEVFGLSIPVPNIFGLNTRYNSQIEYFVVVCQFVLTF